MSDEINHPKHYNSHPSGIECIEIVEEMGFNIGNAIKYLWRQGLKTKPGEVLFSAKLRDLKKAKWYIEREIEKTERQKNNNPSD